MTDLGVFLTELFELPAMTLGSFDIYAGWILAGAIVWLLALKFVKAIAK